MSVNIFKYAVKRFFLNSRFELTKYIAIAQLFTDNTFINEMELIASEPEDVMLLMDYMMEGK